MNRQIKIKQRPSRGFALLFSVFLAGVISAIAISIANIAVKELQLSGTGRESHAAFYAADTGAECALFWDADSQNLFVPDPAPSSLTCFGAATAVTAGSLENDSGIEGDNTRTYGQTYTFATPTDAANPSVCVAVSVAKLFKETYALEGVPPELVLQGIEATQTTVSARGYNGGYRAGPPADCLGEFPNKVERGLKATY